jgi:hypothetical protein
MCPFFAAAFRLAARVGRPLFRDCNETIEFVFLRRRAGQEGDGGRYIWTAGLPDDLALGAYSAVVEAIGEYGQP